MRCRDEGGRRLGWIRGTDRVWNALHSYDGYIDFVLFEGRGKWIEVDCDVIRGVNNGAEKEGARNICLIGSR